MKQAFSVEIRTFISRPIGHFAMKRAFCIEMRTFISRPIGHFAMKCAFFNEMCIFISRPIGHFPTKHAILPLPRIFRGCILQMVDVVMSEHNAGDNTLARMIHPIDFFCATVV